MSVIRCGGGDGGSGRACAGSLYGMRSVCFSMKLNPSACLPPLWYVSLHIACHRRKVSIACIPYRTCQVADVFRVLCELPRSVVVMPDMLPYAPPPERADRHSTWLLRTTTVCDVVVECGRRIVSISRTPYVIASSHSEARHEVTCYGSGAPPSSGAPHPFRAV
jgi:hypothetical protein